VADILIPARSADDWQQFLAKPEKQWVTGRSAKSFAHCWQAARDFPPSVRRVFKLSPYPLFHQIKMLLGIPERPVPLPGQGKASFSDLFVLAKSGDELVSIAVEGKVGEKFDVLISDWLLRDAVPDEAIPEGPALPPSPDPGASASAAPGARPKRSGPSAGKLRRLNYLCQMLELDEPATHDLWYQLLHRTVSALIEAERFNAPHALMLVHSFSPTHERFEDYRAFAERMGVSGAVESNQIVDVGHRAGVDLHLGWAQGEAEWLAV
jgi:hypothetical protein